MRKLTSLRQMLEKYVRKDKITVFTDDGVQTKSQPRALDFRLKYRAVIQIDEFSGEPLLIFAAIGRWITQNEHRTAEDNFFKFDVIILNEKDSFVEVHIDLEETVSVKEDANGELLINVC